MAYNKIITSEGNVQFQSVDGQIINVHPFHIYTTFNEDTVSFILIAMPKQSGLAIFTSKASDLEVDGTVYTIEQLPNALSEAFAKAGAVARYEIVDELPTSGQSNTIYLVPKEEGIGYDEYIYVNGEWELIGDTDIELDRYVTKEVFSGYTADTLVLINTVSGDVITESERAISAETALQEAINNEVSARTEADTALQGLIDTVSGNVETETSRATSAETDLQTAINDEASARTAADEALSGAIDSVSSALTAETSARTDADTALCNKIDGKVVELTQAEYDALVDKDPLILYIITDATEVNMNDYYKKTETSGATELSTAFANETSARTDADAALQGNIDTVSGSVDDLSAEVDIISASLEEEVSARTLSEEVIARSLYDLNSNKATKVDAVASAEYISSSATINFKNISGTVISTIDASDFIIDGMVDDVKIENGYLVITFNTDSGKQDIQIPLTDIFDPSNYYTKDEVDSALSGKVNTSDFETYSGNVATALNSKLDATAYTPTDLSNYYTKSETSGATEIATALNGKQGTLTAGHGIKIANNEVSIKLSISGGTGNSAIIENNGNNVASGDCSHAEGSGTKAKGNFSHAEGRSSIASGSCSHAEGEVSITNGNFSHAEGSHTEAVGNASHAEGDYTKAYGTSSHAEGSDTKANNDYEHASGRFNKSTKITTTFGSGGNTLFSVGNGTADNARHNAFEIRQNGDIYITSGGTDIKLQDALGQGISSGEVQTMIDNSISGKVDTTDFNTYSANTQTAISGKADSSSVIASSAITSAVTSASTDSEIPTAKAVFDAIPTGGTGGGKTISAGTNISVTTGETADTISCTLPITANTASIKSISIGQHKNLPSNQCDGSIVVGYNCSLSYIGTDCAAAMGWYCKANKDFSFAQGNNINANNAAEHSVGRFNNSVTASTTFGDSGNTLFSVGNGTADDARHNAFEIRQNGDIYLNDGTNDVKLQDTITATAANTTALGGLKLVKLTQSEYDALSPDYDANTLYIIKD